MKKIARKFAKKFKKQTHHASQVMPENANGAIFMRLPYHF